MKSSPQRGQNIWRPDTPKAARCQGDRGWPFPRSLSIRDGRALADARVPLLDTGFKDAQHRFRADADRRIPNFDVCVSTTRSASLSQVATSVPHALPAPDYLAFSGSEAADTASSPRDSAAMMAEAGSVPTDSRIRSGGSPRRASRRLPASSLTRS